MDGAHPGNGAVDDHWSVQVRPGANAHKIEVAFGQHLFVIGKYSLLRDTICTRKRFGVLRYNIRTRYQFALIRKRPVSVGVSISHRKARRIWPLLLSSRADKTNPQSYHRYFSLLWFIRYSSASLQQNTKNVSHQVRWLPHRKRHHQPYTTILSQAQNTVRLIMEARSADDRMNYHKKEQ
jgi:hypothetical protein